MNNLLFWSLLPLAFPQALRLKKTALRLPPPECRTYGVVNAVGSECGAPMRLVAVGDSIIRGVGVDLLDDGFVGQAVSELSRRLGRAVDWSVHGRSGARAEHLLDEYLPTLPPEPADVFLLSVGVNDITGLTGIRIWQRRVDRLLAACREHSPNAVVGVAGIPPLGQFPLLPEPLRFATGRRGKAFDAVLCRAVEAVPGAVHMPIEFDGHAGAFCADGFHPSRESYALFGGEMARLIAREIDLRDRAGRSAGTAS